MSNAVDDLRFLYVWLLDAADGIKKSGMLENNDFADGMAAAYEAVGLGLKAILERHDVE